MTVSSETNKASYNGNNSTQIFSTGFIFLDDSHVLVTLVDDDTGVETTQTITTHYTLTGAGTGSAGAVTMLAAPAIGETLIISRNVPLTQGTDYVANDPFPAETHEEALDKLTMIDQQQQEELSRSLRFPLSVDSGVSNEIPTPTAGQYLKFNSAGTAIESISLAENIAEITYENLDANNDIGFGASQVPEGDKVQRVFATVAAMIAATDVAVGDRAVVEDYATGNNSGVLFFKAVAAATGTADGGYYIDSTGSPTVQFKQNFPSVISVKMFGATGDGTTDDTAAIRAAIDYFSSGLGRLYIPDGTYLVTSTLTVAQDRIHIYGAGQHATRIKFEPTANDVCFDITKGASVIYQGSLSNMAFVSDDSTYTKTAVKISDHSGYVVESITSYPWTGSNSIGIELHGREFGVFRNLYLSADRPIVIGTNPNNSISIDHHHFTDLYLTANGNPCVEILTGVNLTQVTFDGANPWVLGTNGLKWVDTTTSFASNGLILRGVRTEQGTSATAYAIDIQHNTALQNLVIDECYLGGDREGIYLRNIVEVILSKSYYVGSTGRVPLNVDSTVSRMKMIGMFWQSGSTASVTGQNILLSGELSGAGLYVDATYTTNTTRDLILGGSIYEKTIELADGATAEIAPASSQGMLFVNDSEGLGAQFHLRGNYNTTTEIADPVGVFSVTATTGSSTNVYWSAGNSRYEIENKRGATRRYRILLIGKYGTF